MRFWLGKTEAEMKRSIWRTGCGDKEGNVATQADVFVYVTPGKVEGAAKAIARLKGVTSAHACWGRPDGVVLAEVPSPTALSQLVLRRLHQVEGVEGTDTRIVVEM
jgi:DNA-binding Lrp family transcriptional regulator